MRFGDFAGGQKEGVLCWCCALCSVLVPRRRRGSGCRPFLVGRMKCCRWLWRDGLAGPAGR